MAYSVMYFGVLFKINQLHLIMQIFIVSHLSTALQSVFIVMMTYNIIILHTCSICNMYWKLRFMKCIYLQLLLYLHYFDNYDDV